MCVLLSPGDVRVGDVSEQMLGLLPRRRVFPQAVRGRLVANMTTMLLN